MTKRSVTHGTFTVERTYDVPPTSVFKAFADEDSKRRWLLEGEGWEIEDYAPAFGIGSCERSRFRFKGGPLITNDTVYQEIVPNQRIIFAYTMTIDGKYISASLATIQFRPAGAGTHLTFTEQCAFLDGHDGAASREHGTRGLLEALARELKRQAARA